jgi:hypothetical protein
MNFNSGPTNYDLPTLGLIVVVRASLINVSSTAVLLGLAGRHSAITPSGLIPVAPSGWTLVTTAIGSVLVSRSAFPPLIVVIIEMLVSVLVFVSLVPVICHQCWRT